MIPRQPAGRSRLVLSLAAGLLLAGGAVALAVAGLGEGSGADSPARAGSAAPPTASAADRDLGNRTPGPDAPRNDRVAPGAAGADRTRPSETRDRASTEATGERQREGGAERGSEGDGAGRPQGAGGAGPGPDVAEILERAERTYAALSSLRARFRQTIEVPLMDRRREGHGIWYQEGRGRFRMDFLEPPEDEIVADGEHLWLYYPSTNPKQVIKSGLESGETRAGTADVLSRILQEARTAYEGRYVDRERVAGVETRLVSLRPLDPRSPYRRVRVWIGIEDDLVRRFEITEANETVRTVTLRELEPNVEIPEGTFRFTPPPDADVFER